MQAEATIPSGLPEPDENAKKHSERTLAFIREHIRRQGGRITFGDFMQQALYASGYGYYAAGAVKFGPDGDFVTAPEISPLFGRIVANQCAEVLAQTHGGDILELGAGSGALAASVLQKLDELDALPGRYLILEPSADLEARQRRRLQPLLEGVPASVEWIETLPAAMNGVVLANEVADALPVERFWRAEEELRQCYVEVEDRGLVVRWASPTEALAAAVRDIEHDLGRRLPAGFRSEVSLGLGDWITQLVGALDDGVMLLFDYGLPRREYYAPDRREGWLRCHFRHHVHQSPLVFPGIQDLTAWVDFSAIARAARRAGFEVAGFVTQAVFLINGGLDNEYRQLAGVPAAQQFELAQAVKRLALPSEMGENFKCLGISKPDRPPPSAFTNGDRTHSL